MPKPKVLALVLAGGEGSRLELLTERRATPALPFAGVYRLIDFPLSNCVHSGIEDVWVLQQYRLQSLSDQLANGRRGTWTGPTGGLRLLPPQLGSEDDGFHEGNADAIWRKSCWSSAPTTSTGSTTARCWPATASGGPG
jgi:glucose-1-phosphate adenylyltransferase